MKFDVISLFPDIVQAVVQQGVIGQALKKQIFSIYFHNPRQWTTDVHRTVDDRPFGGGDGMVMLSEPWSKAIESVTSVESEKPWVVYLSPQGSVLNSDKIQQLKSKKHLVLICGRYAGLDQRVINRQVDEEISIGDYVLSGGELAAAVVVDAVVRHLPGVLGHAQSAEADSHSDTLGGRLEAPLYTRPREFLGQEVPEILLSGHHEKINHWREMVSWFVTLKKRPDLILDTDLSAKNKQILWQFWLTLSDADRDSLGLLQLDEKVKNWLL